MTVPPSPSSSDAERGPALLESAVRIAAGFGLPTTEPVDTRHTSIVPGAGRLLSVLTALITARPDARVLELGTGGGVGTAWILHGMAPDAHLLTIEVDPARAKAARALFASEPRVTVLQGDWHEVIRGQGQFDLAFPDAGLSTELEPEDWDAVVDLVTVGGALVLDDLTPLGSADVLGNESAKRRFAFGHPRLLSAEVAVSPKSSVAVAVRRS